MEPSDGRSGLFGGRVTDVLDLAVADPDAVTDAVVVDTPIPLLGAIHSCDTWMAHAQT